MIRAKSIVALSALIAGLSLPQFLAARAKDRITQKIDDSRPATLRGNVHPLARPQSDQGRVSPAKVLPRMVMVFNRTAQQQAELESLLEQQQDPSSPNFHRWLTPEQFADRFGMSATDLAQVTEWLQGRGFTIVETPPSRTYVAFGGTVGQVDSVFRTEIHRYKLNGEEHIANAAEPVVPAALADVVLALHGMDDFRPHPRVKARPQFTSDISGNHFMSPDDFATIYNLQPVYAMGLDGTGQSIAVVGQTDIILSDVQRFRVLAGLPAKDPQVILVPGSADPGIVYDDLVEADLDVEWTMAIARNATILYVNSGNGAFDSMTYAISHNLAPIISSSYGACETVFPAGQLNTFSSLGQQANAQGQTLISASGDSGAADCDFNTSTATQGLVVDMPAALPYTTGIGGTRFNDGGGTFGTQFWSTANNYFFGSALSYIPEVTWNDSGAMGATGGGAAINFTKPVWQTGTGVPNDGKRDVPDVSFSASPRTAPYLICGPVQGTNNVITNFCIDGFRASDTTLNVVGGTSAGAPAFAGVVALLNQLAGTAQGNVNPRLYQLAAVSSDVFHDITIGNNNVSCQIGTPNCTTGTMGFSAGTGYDQVTGLGTMNVYNLVTQWMNVAITPNPIKFGNMLPNIAKTVAVTIRNNNGPSLTINGISISGNFIQTNNCPGTLSYGGSCTVTVTLPPTASSSQTGTLTVTSNDGPNGASNDHPIPISATVGDLAIQISGASRLVRSAAGPAPVASTTQSVVSSQNATSTTGATTQLVSATAAVPNIAISPVRWTAEGWGSLTVTNRQSAAVTIEVVAAGDITQESDCATQLDAGASCEIRVARSKASSTGELKITTPDGITKVRIAAE